MKYVASTMSFGLTCNHPRRRKKSLLKRIIKSNFLRLLNCRKLKAVLASWKQKKQLKLTLVYVSSDAELTVQNVTFILKGNTLFTYRQGELKIFAESVRKLKSASSEMKEHGLRCLFIDI